MKPETREPADVAVERRLLARRPDEALDRLFGPAQHAELRELARAALQRPGGPCVLILPGVMGSTLGLRRARRTDDIVWFDPVEVALGRLDRLTLPSARRIEPLGVLLFAYLRLKLSLRAAGLDADFHPYDWRRSVHAAGAALAARIARELDTLNRAFLTDGRPYLLIGFGRWGSSDASLGIPVEWGQSSGARTIVEATLPNMAVDPSQGSHFFHNISSFKVSYFSVAHEGARGINWSWLAARPAAAETDYIRHLRLDAPLSVKVDGRTGRGLIRVPR